MVGGGFGTPYLKILATQRYISNHFTPQLLQFLVKLFDAVLSVSISSGLVSVTPRMISTDV